MRSSRRAVPIPIATLVAVVALVSMSFLCDTILHGVSFLLRGQLLYWVSFFSNVFFVYSLSYYYFVISNVNTLVYHIVMRIYCRLK